MVSLLEIRDGIYRDSKFIYPIEGGKSNMMKLISISLIVFAQVGCGGILLTVETPSDSITCADGTTATSIEECELNAAETNNEAQNQCQTDGPNLTDEAPALLFGNESKGVGSLPITQNGYVKLAQGFELSGQETMSKNGYVLTSVVVALVIPAGLASAIDSNTLALDIALYSSSVVNGLTIPDSRIRTFNSKPSNNDGAFQVNRSFEYVFEYSGSALTLEPGKQYWIVVGLNPEGASNTLYWQNASAPTNDLPEYQTPVEWNGSGLSYLGTVAKHTTHGWTDVGESAGALQNSGLRVGIYGYETAVSDASLEDETQCIP
jgi:hypothetical protein